jgi:hypothetical protein
MPRTETRGTQIKDGTVELADLSTTAKKLPWGFALSDETTDLTTGTKLTWRVPYAFTVTGVRISINTVSSSGVVDVDVKQNDSSIFSTRPTIDVGEKTSVTAVTPAVISTSSLTDDAELTFIIVSAGTGAKGLKINILGQPA